ncbi:MAG: hypothetical protein M0029_01250 [Actinomycetota bacterium]|nr:hypothetical protein [Actinomycetota bacterium]
MSQRGTRRPIAVAYDGAASSKDITWGSPAGCALRLAFADDELGSGARHA